MGRKWTWVKFSFLWVRSAQCRIMPAGRVTARFTSTMDGNPAFSFMMGKGKLGCDGVFSFIE